MNKEMFDKGLAIRKSVIGAEFVDKALANADDFNMPLQELVTEYCWGAVWGREGSVEEDAQPAQHRDARHAEPAERAQGSRQRRDPQRRDEGRDPRDLMQVAIYAGVPAAVDSFRLAKEALAEIDRQAIAPVSSVGVDAEVVHHERVDVGRRLELLREAARAVAGLRLDPDQDRDSRGSRAPAASPRT